MAAAQPYEERHSEIPPPWLLLLGALSNSSFVHDFKNECIHSVLVGGSAVLYYPALGEERRLNLSTGEPICPLKFSRVRPSSARLPSPLPSSPGANGATRPNRIQS